MRNKEAKCAHQNGLKGKRYICIVECVCLKSRLLPVNVHLVFGGSSI